MGRHPSRRQTPRRLQDIGEDTMAIENNSAFTPPAPSPPVAPIGVGMIPAESLVTARQTWQQSYIPPKDKSPGEIEIDKAVWMKRFDDAANWKPGASDQLA